VFEADERVVTAADPPEGEAFRFGTLVVAPAVARVLRVVIVELVAEPLGARGRSTAVIGSRLPHPEMIVQSYIIPNMRGTWMKR
jgi:hypothetical protein